MKKDKIVFSYCDRCKRQTQELNGACRWCQTKAKTLNVKDYAVRRRELLVEEIRKDEELLASHRLSNPDYYLLMEERNDLLARLKEIYLSVRGGLTPLELVHVRQRLKANLARLKQLEHK